MRSQFGGVEFQLDLPVEQGALRDSKPHPARDQRLRAGGSQRVDVGAVLPSNLDQIFESRVGEQRHPRAAPLQQRVGGDRRTVGEHAGVGVAEQHAHPFEDRRRRIVRRGKQLVDAQFAVDHGGHVGERPAGVDTDYDRSGAALADGSGSGHLLGRFQQDLEFGFFAGARDCGEAF